MGERLLVGWELDAAVDRVVFGINIQGFDKPGQSYTTGTGSDGLTLWRESGAPPYSTEIEAAWQVVERMIELGHLDTSIRNSYGDEWVVSFSGRYAGGSTAPEAICRAALISLAARGGEGGAGGGARDGDPARA